MGTLRAYACTVKGAEWGETTIHAMSRGKAAYRYLLDVREPWPDITFKDIRVRTLGPPRDTEKFLHTAKYRGVTFHIGSRVRVGDSEGFVVDSNSSANFCIEFVSGRYEGCRLSAHASEITEVPHA